MPASRYRFTYEKTGPVTLLGHLDIVRELPRILKRAGLTAAYTKGFHPKPDMTYGPALSLGVMSLDEHVDIKLVNRLTPAELDTLPRLLTERSPEGLRFTAVRALAAGDPSVSKMVSGAKYVLVFARRAVETTTSAPAEAVLASRVKDLLDRSSLEIKRPLGAPVLGKVPLSKVVDLRGYIRSLAVGGPEVDFAVQRAGIAGDVVGVVATVSISPSGAVKSAEIAEALMPDVPHQAVRTRVLLDAVADVAPALHA